MKTGDLVRDADGEVWTVLNRPIDDIPGAETPGLFRRERSPQVQQYGNHMRHPLTILSYDDIQRARQLLDAQPMQPRQRLLSPRCGLHGLHAECRSVICECECHFQWADCPECGCGVHLDSAGRFDQHAVDADLDEHCIGSGRAAR